MVYLAFYCDYCNKELLIRAEKLCGVCMECQAEIDLGLKKIHRGLRETKLIETKRIHPKKTEGKTIEMFEVGGL